MYIRNITEITAYSLIVKIFEIFCYNILIPNLSYIKPLKIFSIYLLPYQKCNILHKNSSLNSYTHEEYYFGKW